ncbi:MAG: KilA-N domain-containing protein [Neisseriaceae bacterium]|nr:MAG: KilA-N domain-containing protein [Neisseriaceae bacterium]
MSNLPMAIDTSIQANQCQFELIKISNNLYFDDFLIEVNHQLIESKIAIFLGLNELEIEKSAVAIDLNYKFGRSRMMGLTIAQVQQLFQTTQNQVANKYKPILSELILTQVMPLFNQQHDDFKKEAIMKHEIVQRRFNDQIVTFDLGDDVMLNLTQMAKANGKDVFAWRELKSTQEYLTEYQTQNSGFEANQILKVVKGGKNPGTWANQDVALEFARWCNPKFAIWCNMQIKELLKNGSVNLNKTPTPKSSIGNASLMRLELKEIHAMDISEKSKQVLIANIIHHNNPVLPLELMLPASNEEMLSPEQIGMKLGLSGNAIGHIITRLGLRDNTQYCEKRLGQSKYSRKQVEQYFYNQRAIELITKEVKAS